MHDTGLMTTVLSHTWFIFLLSLKLYLFLCQALLQNYFIGECMVEMSFKENNFQISCGKYTHNWSITHQLYKLSMPHLFTLCHCNLW